MSVLIKGIHIPTGCAVCFYNRDSRCLLLPGSGYDETNGENRRPNCPIIELPDHGDLVDVDLLKADCKEPNVWWETEYQMGYVLAAAKVIIPAERSE